MKKIFVLLLAELLILNAYALEKKIHSSPKIEKKFDKTELNVSVSGSESSEHSDDRSRKLPHYNAYGILAFVGAMYVVGGVFYWLIGSQHSYKRVSGGFPPERRREPGEPTLPYVKAAINYQYLDNNNHSSSFEGELGYGPAAIAIRNTNYQSFENDQKLEALELIGVLRMSSWKSFEIDLGFGLMSLEDSRTQSGQMWTLPFQYHWDESLGFRFRPTWAWVGGKTINDFDLGVLLSYEYVSLKAGYRWFKDQHQELKGPVIGIEVRY